MKTIKLGLLCLFITSFTSFSFSSFAENEKLKALKISTKQESMLGIQVVKVQAETMQKSVPYAGQVVIPIHQIRAVNSPIEGLIHTMHVALYQPVRKGQVLAQIKSPVLLETQSALMQTKSQLDIAQENAKRDARLFQEGVIPERRYHESQAQVKQLSAAYQAKQQMLGLYGASSKGLNYTITIQSPLDGIVIEQNANSGQRVDSSTAIYKIAQLKPLWVEMQIPVNIADRLRVGEIVSLKNTQNSQQYNAKIILIGRNVHAANQTVTVRTEVTQGTESLRPGQMIQAEVDQATQGSTWKVPNQAIFNHKGKNYLYLEKSQKDFDFYTPTEIKVLSQNASVTTFQSTQIKAGNEIVVKGISSLKAMSLGFGGE